MPRDGKPAFLHVWNYDFPSNSDQAVALQAAKTHTQTRKHASAQPLVPEKTTGCFVPLVVDPNDAHEVQRREILQLLIDLLLQRLVLSNSAPFLPGSQSRVLTQRLQVPPEDGFWGAKKGSEYPP